MLYRQAAILELTGSLLDTPAVLGLNFSMRDQMRKAKRTYGYLLLSMEHSAGYRSHVQSFASPSTATTCMHFCLDFRRPTNRAKAALDWWTRTATPCCV